MGVFFVGGGADEMTNWDAIRKEWETTEITLAALAEKHNVKLGTLKSRKSRERWSRDATEKDATKNATTNKKVATTGNEISWIDIENEYVTDIRKKPCTLKDLAEKYQIPVGTIEKYSMDNRWSEKRRSYKENIKQKTVKKISEQASDGLADVTLRHLSISNKLLNILEEAVDTPNEFNKVTEILRTGYAPGEFDERIVVEVVDALNEKKLATVINSLDRIQKMQRQTLGILDAKDQHKVEMDKRKLGDHEEEYEDDGFLEALEGKAEEVWGDYDGES